MAQDAPSAQLNNDRSKAFLTQTKDQVLQRFPDLAKAYEVRDELQRIARDALPINETVSKQLDVRLQQTVAAAVARGSEPKIVPSTAEAVRFQVAYASAEHAVGSRRLDPASTVNISPQHREILVRHAEKSIATSNADRPAATAEVQTRARETAGLVGLLDLPKTNNPFKNDDLKQSYTVQQQEALSRQAQRSAERSSGFER